MATHRCGSCRRHLLVGELFRTYRRRVRRGSVLVCSLCRERVEARGWLRPSGPVLRQQVVRPHVARPRKPLDSVQRPHTSHAR